MVVQFRKLDLNSLYQIWRGFMLQFSNYSQQLVGDNLRQKPDKKSALSTSLLPACLEHTLLISFEIFMSTYLLITFLTLLVTFISFWAGFSWFSSHKSILVLGIRVQVIPSAGFV